MGVFLGILGEWIIEKQERAKQERVEMARTKILHQFSEEDDAAPPKQFSFLNDCKNIVVSMVPIFSILICMAIPLAYLEGWGKFICLARFLVNLISFWSAHSPAFLPE